MFELLFPLRQRRGSKQQDEVFMEENKSAVYEEPDLELTTILIFNWNNSQRKN